MVALNSAILKKPPGAQRVRDMTLSMATPND